VRDENVEVTLLDIKKPPPVRASDEEGASDCRGNPCHDLPKGTLASILRQAQLEESDE